MFRQRSPRQAIGIAERKINKRLKMRIAELEQQLGCMHYIRPLQGIDALTGLPNRLCLHEALQRIIEVNSDKQTTVAVLLLDLDRFKLINETLGHKTGDQLLVAVTRRLLSCVDDEEKVCRLGGDEFLIILPQATADDASAMARLVLEELARSYRMEGFELFITASIGISLYPSDGEDADSLMKNAESAMYRAKEQGKNNYQLYNEAINANLIWRLALENRLRRALENEEFRLVYQPEVDVYTSEIIGMEALVRWYNPEAGMVSPGQFIPLAEETGLIVPLGEWVMREACEQNKLWREMGFPPLRVSVNLSARQFQEADLLITIESILRETGLDATGLTIELTESIIMADPEKTINILQQLKAMGIHIAIDDFGTGYSSLSYLKRFPLAILKIDKSFIDGVTQDAEDAAIVTAITQMAHSLKLRIVAEGVEQAEQLEYLKDCACDAYQGYYFSKPVAAEDFTKLLAKNFPVKDEDQTLSSGQKEPS